MATAFLQKNLSDIVKGIRSHKKNEAEYIQKCIAEIKDEFKSPETKVKVVGVQKVTYLGMLGYDMEWASFRIVEVMAETSFQHKRSGYLAAAQCFTQKTDVVALTTNLFKKDMQSSNQYEAGLALSCLGCICTPDLARDLVSDVVSLLSSQRAYIRKKVVLVLLKLFLQFPESLRPSFPRLKEKLEDSDPSVVASTVNTICELARKNPGNYLGMAKLLFGLLNTIQNNWTLIKIVKLFGVLTPLEPRLAKKLVEPLTNIVNTTPAKSLLYECLATISIGMAKEPGILRLALEKLKLFVEDRDQNLKYLGLLGLSNIMKHSPKLVADMRDTVMECLGDEDITIRYRALELVVGMVNKRTISSIVGRLCEQVMLHEGDYKNDLINKIIETCSQDSYHYVTNFEWYLRVLMDLVQCEVKHVRHGEVLAFQFSDVIVRVKAIREFGVRCMTTVLGSTNIILESLDTDRSNLCEVLSTAGWLCGEFVEYVNDPRGLVENLLQPMATGLPARTQTIFVQAVMKVYAYAAGEEDEDTELIEALRGQIKADLKPFLQSSDVEVQERAAQVERIVKLHMESRRAGEALASLFSEELPPVGATAQAKVPIPEGLDLDEAIVEYESSSEEEEEPESEEEDDFPMETSPPASSMWSGHGNANILKDDPSSKRRSTGRDDKEPDIVKLQMDDLDALGTAGYKRGGYKDDAKKSRRHKDKDSKRRRRHSSESSDGAPEVSRVVDLPEGVSEHRKHRSSSSAAATIEANPLHKALDQDLFKPLGKSEVLPTIEAYKREDPEDYMRARDKEKEKKRKAKEKKEKERRKREKEGDEKEKDSGSSKRKKDKPAKEKSSTRERRSSSHRDKEKTPKTPTTPLDDFPMDPVPAASPSTGAAAASSGSRDEMDDWWAELSGPTDQPEERSRKGEEEAPSRKKEERDRKGSVKGKKEDRGRDRKDREKGKKEEQRDRDRKDRDNGDKEERERDRKDRDKPPKGKKEKKESRRRSVTPDEEEPRVAATASLAPARQAPGGDMDDWWAEMSGGKPQSPVTKAASAPPAPAPTQAPKAASAPMDDWWAEMGGK